MKQEKPYVLAMNGGSSSIKFTLYRMGDSLKRRLHGKVDRIGLRGTTLTFDDLEHNQHDSRIIGDFGHRPAANFLLDWLDEQIGLVSIEAVGHRIVYGSAHYNEPQRATPELLDALRRISVYAPEHLPSEITVIDLFRERVPGMLQIACFDTAFHHNMPRVAKILPIPRRFQEHGIERYGFHGLSYSYLMEELVHVASAEAARGRVILAHLGNGASLAAVRGGKSIDTSMGFTPAAGVPMGTRSGDLDPGLVGYLAQTEHMTAEQFHHMVNHESGLLGVSETSSDLRDLLVRETEDVRAAEAVALFCYQTKKCIGAFAAALGGLDTLVFAGGIGENSPVIRARICGGLEFLGIEIEEKRNVANVDVISAETSRAVVRVMHTDEEVMIAKLVCRVLGLPIEKENAYGHEDKKS
ncbi:acetate kinase [Sulfuricaulis limicola]|uniref:Acetate kinase n=1 Tax=Sulfuricaulis limicola TaxID=1620215 RepID=A0A1B4XH01_9GAMM|nr:acetate/propionate family kinase [Sulfuricaulis limicola]BAV34075.1 acetate kinase [Sulfuricaulis limicola]